jgi:hypothetical protein
VTRGRAQWRALPTLALLAALDAGAQTRLVIVSGLGGTPRFTQSFGALSTTLATAAHERLGLPDSTITWLGEPAAPRSKWYRGPSHRDTVERVLERLAERPATEQLVLVLVGHGSGEGDDTRISLPGPDLTTRDFARILGRFGARRLAFVNLTSASGDMAERLAAPGRVVITATTSAFERNESHFGSFFVAAFAREGADTDKDNRVSLLEAFRYAEAETKRLYDDDGRLATEHARLVDRSAMAPQFFLTPGAAASGVTTERLATLYAERAALDEQVQLLKARKASMSQDAYETELERLLVALALTAREIRELEKGR